MKKLEKLNAKKIDQLQHVVGGIAIFIEEISVLGGDGCTPCTTHEPSKGTHAPHYTCDHGTDDIK